VVAVEAGSRAVVAVCAWVSVARRRYAGISTEPCCVHLNGRGGAGGEVAEVVEVGVGVG